MQSLMEPRRGLTHEIKLLIGVLLETASRGVRDAKITAPIVNSCRWTAMLMRTCTCHQFTW